jgi:hypothetical protein
MPAAFLLILGVAFAAARLGALDTSFLFCPFHHLTGLPCPLCGITRAWVALVHGRLAEAVGWHPFVAGIIPALVAAGFGWHPSATVCRAGLIALACFGIVRIAIHTL